MTAATMGPIYGEDDKELVLDQNSLGILELDLLEVMDELGELLEAFHEAPRDAQMRIMRVHASFISAYGNLPNFKADGYARLWAAAMDTALIWEQG